MVLDHLLEKAFCVSGLSGTLTVTTAGGRRFQALQILVKSKRLAKTAPIPCNVRAADSSIPAEEDSLAENAHQVALHPLDQFRAFKNLVDGGTSVEDVQDKAKEKISDVEAAIRRNPSQAALIAAGIGFVFGLILSR